MTITQTIEIPADRRITVPNEVPTGRTIIAFTPANADNSCPICAMNRDPETGELRFNAETRAAIEEGDAILRGDIPAKRYSSLQEMLVDLESDD